MSMYLSYATPLHGVVTRADRVSAHQREAARQTRRMSRNDSHTIRHFNAEGVVDYCVSVHQSFHGHGYITEIILHNDMLTRRTTYEDGTVQVEGGLDAARWKQTQRKDLLIT